jgi:hypothetical protein
MATILRALPYTLIFIGYAASAAAGVCGDDVAGERIACACGDTVVASARLQRNDPVASGPCPSNGLILDAATGVESVSLDLAGLSLLGSGSGTGVLVRDGGAAGATLIGGPDGRPGQIAGFRVGISARGSRGIRDAANLIVSGNEQDGVRIAGRASTLSGIVADENGRSGVVARGRDHALDGVAARKNGHHDLRVSGNGNFVATDESSSEGTTNRITGSGNVVTGAEVQR